MSDNNAEIAVNFRMNEMMIDEAFENAMASSKAATFASMKQHLQQQPMNSIYTIAKVRKLTLKFIESFLTNFAIFQPHPQQTQFNIDAPPFEMPSAHYRNMPKIKIGPSAVEVNSNIWSAIASNRPLPHLQSMPQLTIASPTQSSSLFSPMASTMSSPVVNAHYGYNGVGYVSWNFFFCWLHNFDCWFSTLSAHRPPSPAISANLRRLLSTQRWLTVSTSLRSRRQCRGLRWAATQRGHYVNTNIH